MLLDSKSFIVDESGVMKSVVLDYKDYQKLEEALLDEGLVKAMEETANDEEVDVAEAKWIVGRK